MWYNDAALALSMPEGARPLHRHLVLLLDAPVVPLKEVREGGREGGREGWVVVFSMSEGESGPLHRHLVLLLNAPVVALNEVREGGRDGRRAGGRGSIFIYLFIYLFIYSFVYLFI